MESNVIPDKQSKIGPYKELARRQLICEKKNQSRALLMRILLTYSFIKMNDDAILEESSLQQLSQLDQDKILTCVKTP